MTNPGQFLALCLFDAIRDENIFNAKTLITKYKASACLTDKQNGIAAIHYVAGMECRRFADEIMKCILENDANPNVRTEDQETPLHIASFWGHGTIVKLLLRYGADITALDNENHTPIQCALNEMHYDMIDLFKTYIYEKGQLSEEKSNFLSVNQNINGDYRKTPKGIQYYNFDRASPYYINITHRRKNIKPLNNDHENELSPHNIFELNETNLREFTQSSSNNNGGGDLNSSVRRSLIDKWRHKVDKLKPKSNCNLDEIDTFLNTLNESQISFHISLLSSTCKQSDVIDERVTDDDHSFKTAESKHDESSIRMKSPKIDAEFMYHVTEDYIYTDDECGVKFVERKVFAEPVANRNDNVTQTDLSSIASMQMDIPLAYDTDDLHRELTQYGDPPGPITNTTKKLYMKRLMKYKRNPEYSNITDRNASLNPTYSFELQKTLKNEKNFPNILNSYIALETNLVDHFKSAKLKNQNFREGHLKTSFIYLLIDPRISANLPGEAKTISLHKAWSRFLQSIFYVGKGKSSRPYSHLYDAIKLYQQKENDLDKLLLNDEQLCKSQKTVQRRLYANTKVYSPKSNNNNNITESTKLKRILDIWKDKKGVVCLHIFHNTIPAEAYTREAAIIDSFGLDHLTNLKRGDYYGAPQSWTMRMRKELGVILLYKAFQIFLAEGETQLHPSDIV